MASFAEAVAETMAAASTEPTATAVEAPAGAETEEVSEPIAAPEDTGTEPEPAAEKYSFKADGVEREVTLEELQQLAAAGENYTRKTQELAVQRQQLREAEALWQALTDTPEETVRRLAEQLGLETAETEPLDPEEQRIRRLEQTVSRGEHERAEAARMAHIDRSLDTLHEQYGEFEDADLLAYAIDRQITDLTAAYRDMKFEEIRQEALDAREAQRAKSDETRTDAKREAAVVAGGSATQTGTVEDSPLPDKPTLRQSFLHAAGRK